MSGPSSCIVEDVPELSNAAILPAVMQVYVVEPSIKLTCMLPAAVVLSVVRVSAVKSAS